MQYIRLYKKELAKKLNKQSVNKWVNKDYVGLSESIAEKVKVSVSPNTLKRIFGKLAYRQGKFTPQKASLNALAQFIDYKDWNAFVLKQNSIKQRFYIRLFSIVSGAILLGVVFFIAKYHFIIPKGIKPKLSYSLALENPNAPVIAKLTYQIHNKQEQYYVDFSPSTSWRIPLLKENNQVQYLYKNPGYYNAFIMEENNTLDTLSLLVASIDYKINIAHDRKYDRFDKSILSENGRFYISPSIIESLQLDSKEYWTVFEHYKHYNCSGDNFTFQSKIKSPLKEGAVLGQVIATKIKCQNGQIVIPLADSLGAAEIKVVVSEKEHSGRYEALHGFTVNLNEYVNLQVHNQNQHLIVSLDEKQIFEETYKRPLGDIVGITVSFFGSGSMDYLKLMDQHDSIVYNEDFSYAVSSVSSD